jgi:hypothetical protein
VLLLLLLPQVFVFMAAEEPLTPDEIMAAQHFFG